jgi:CRISPR system Cascade subunit CasD
LAAWANRDMQIVAYTGKDRRGDPLIRQPLLRDFHMVGSGYNDRDPWESLLIPRTSEGKKAVGGGTKMTYRYYLQDMAYAVAIQGPESLIHEAADALKSPVWDLYLGRKNCVPTDFIFRGVFQSAEEALHMGSEIAMEKSKAFSFKVLQGEHDGELLTLNDVPLQFGVEKKYRDRQVTVQLTE